MSIREAVVPPKMVADRHVFADFAEVQVTGERCQSGLVHAVQQFAEEHGIDLGDLQISWEVRVEAIGYEEPREVLYAASEQASDPVKHREKMRAMWLGQVERLAKRREPILVQIETGD